MTSSSSAPNTGCIAVDKADDRRVRTWRRPDFRFEHDSKLAPNLQLDAPLMPPREPAGAVGRSSQVAAVAVVNAGVAA